MFVLNKLPAVLTSCKTNALQPFASVYASSNKPAHNVSSSIWGNASSLIWVAGSSVVVGIVFLVVSGSSGAVVFLVVLIVGSSGTVGFLHLMQPPHFVPAGYWGVVCLVLLIVGFAVVLIVGSSSVKSMCSCATPSALSRQPRSFPSSWSGLARLSGLALSTRPQWSARRHRSDIVAWSTVAHIRAVWLVWTWGQQQHQQLEQQLEQPSASV